MTHLNTLCAVVGAFLMTSVRVVNGQLDTHGDRKWGGTQTQFDKLPNASTPAQTTYSSTDSSFEKDLGNLIDHVLSLSTTFRKEVHEQPSTNVTDRNHAAGVKNFQELLLSAAGGMSSGSSSSACVNDTALLITSIYQRQRWALQYLDSFGKPGPGLTRYRLIFIGDYRQCRSIQTWSSDGSRIFNGNYCTLKSIVGSVKMAVWQTVELGACLPDTCSAEDNTRFVEGVINLLGVKGTLHTIPAVCHTEDIQMTTATIMSIVVLVIIGILMVIGTGFDIILIHWPKWKAAKPGAGLPFTDLTAQFDSHAVNEEENQTAVADTTRLLDNTISTKQETHSVDPGICHQVLLAFSVYTNGSKVLDTRQSEGSLSAIHGIRFLTMTWVLIGHFVLSSLINSGNINTVFKSFMKVWTYDAVTNAYASVDTFFTTSGLLTAYLTLNEMKKKGWKINWPLFYFHRFWRLTPPYMLTILVVTGLQLYLGSGPLWPSESEENRNCENNWWTNLLYINNLVNTDKECFAHSWYLANDMQFYILSPLFIVPIYFNRFVGVAVCLGFLLVSWITTGVLSTLNQWPPSLDSPVPDGNSTIHSRNYYEYYYIKPWCRIGPYIIGLLAGAYLSLRRKKRLPAVAVCSGWAVATATNLAILYGLHDYINGQHLDRVGLIALYNAVAKSAWGASVAWVIIACSSGYGGFANTILSWSPFVFLSRLTYMAYLIHPCLVSVYFQNLQTLFYIGITSLAVSMSGIVVITSMVAFVLMLALESPWIGLEKTFIHKRAKS
ncbi:hypothetical protein BsWGS_23665 [Bradybaena similaris]